MTGEQPQVSESPDKLTLVLVKWHDARIYSDARREATIANCRMQLFSTVGYLLRRDKTTTTIAFEYNDEGEYRDVLLIPTGSILSIEYLLISKEPLPYKDKDFIPWWEPIPPATVGAHPPATTGLEHSTPNSARKQ